MTATAERYGVRASALLGLPPDDAWLCYCVDEALHVLAVGHHARDLKWDERHRKEPGDTDGEFDKHAKLAADPRAGRPPSAQELDMIPFTVSSDDG